MGKKEPAATPAPPTTDATPVGPATVPPPPEEPHAVIPVPPVRCYRPKPETRHYLPVNEDGTVSLTEAQAEAWKDRFTPA